MTNGQHAFYEADCLNTEIYNARAALDIAGSPVDGDVEFYRGLARKTGGPVLDVGCGTGRVALELARDGHEVLGVDLSGPMLALAERGRSTLLPEVAERVAFQQADMTTLSLGRRFGLVITPARSFQFMLTDDAQRSALLAMRAHLRPDGLLILDLFDPRLDWCVPTDAPLAPRRGEVVHPDNGNRVVFEVTARTLDPARQLLHEAWTTSELDAAGEVVRSETETLTLRWSLRSELRHLFELTGLEVVGDYGDFAGSPPAYGREQVWVLRGAR